MSKKNKVLVIISSFPKPPFLMNLSPWALEQTKELAKLIDCTVVSPTPNLWTPKVFHKLLPFKVKRWSNIEAKHDFESFVSLYPRVPVRTYTRKARFYSSVEVTSAWIKAIERNVNVKEFDLVLAHHPMVEGFIAKHLKDKYKIPFITIEHSHDDPFNGNEEYKINYSLVANHADAFISPSKHVLKSISTKYSVKNPIVICNGGSQPLHEPKNFDFSQGKIKFISVGALSEYKNYRTLISAFDDLFLRENAELEIIGDGPLRQEYEDLVTAMHLENVVKLSGPVPHNLVLQKLDKAHVFCLISNENLSVAAVEAMGRGLPPVVSESTGIAELIKDGIEGFVIRDDSRMDSKHVASILRRFITDPALLPKMSEAALERSRSLTWGANAKEMFHLIKQILKIE